MKVEFYEMVNKIKSANWKKSFGISDDGVIFAPGAAMGDEVTVEMCAHYDGMPCITYKKHLFVPIEWMRKEDPASAEFCDAVQRSANKALALG